MELFCWLEDKGVFPCPVLYESDAVKSMSMFLWANFVDALFIHVTN